MNKQTPAPSLTDGLVQWLMDQGLQECPLGDLTREFGKRVLAGGIPLHRIAIGGMVLHPVFGAMDINWDAQTDAVKNDKFPRSGFADPAFQNSPFFYSTVNNILFKVYDLEAETTTPTFPIFDKLRDQGITTYIVSYLPYGNDNKILWADLPEVGRGVVCSFSTRRIGGFTDHDLKQLEALTRPLAMCVKASTTHELAETVLNTYLGSYSGGQVLDGLVERGDGKLIDCVLWYADLRNSTPLAEQMPLEEFLAMINDYFECAAGAVLDHGGEVLRFIGDAVIAIFPYEADQRPIVDMTRAAASAAREAVARVNRNNKLMADTDRPPIRFGVSMHIGSVMYGNIGTERRLEFSVIGPAANEVVRLEGLCKKLRTQIVASSKFNEIFPEDMIALGNHPAEGVRDGLTAFALSDFPPELVD